MNKKAFVVEFLVVVLLSVLLFTSACLVTSKFFRLSSQAEDSFVSFVKDINSLGEKGKINENRSSVLLLDKATSVYIFPKNSKVIERKAISPPLKDYVSKVSVNRPTECTEGQACACLCQEISPKWSSSGILRTAYEIEIECKKYRCKSILFEIKPIEATASELGEVEYSKSFFAASDYPTTTGATLGVMNNNPDNYFISGGVALERHIDTVPFGIIWGDLDQRRIFTKLEKCTSLIEITENSELR